MPGPKVASSDNPAISVRRFSAVVALAQGNCMLGFGAGKASPTVIIMINSSMFFALMQQSEMAAAPRRCRRTSVVGQVIENRHRLDSLVMRLALRSRHSHLLLGVFGT